MNNIKKAFETATGLLNSTRFFIIQESIATGFVGCILYATILPKFPITEFLIFLGPVALGAYGLKTVEHIRARNGPDLSDVEVK